MPKNRTRIIMVGLFKSQDYAFSREFFRPKRSFRHFDGGISGGHGQRYCLEVLRRNGIVPESKPERLGAFDVPCGLIRRNLMSCRVFRVNLPDTFIFPDPGEDCYLLKPEHYPVHGLRLRQWLDAEQRAAAA